MTYLSKIRQARMFERNRAESAVQGEEVRSLINWLTSAKVNSESMLLPDNHKAVLSGVADRLRRGQATELDRIAFARAFFRAEFEGRRIVPAIGLSPPVLKMSLIGRDHNVADGMFLYCSLFLFLDADAIDLKDKGCFVFDLATINPLATYSIFAHVDQHIARLKPATSHRLHGYVRISVGESTRPKGVRSIFTQVTELNEIPISSDYVELEIAPLSFTLVDRLPDDYPLRIVDGNAAQRFRDCFSLKKAELTSGRQLDISLSMVQPGVSIACNLNVSVAMANWDSTYALTWPHDANLKIKNRRGMPDISYGGKGDRMILHVELPETIVKGLRDGMPICLRLISDRAVALDDWRITEYLEVSAQQSITIESALMDRPG
jgi:hypothetical protein